MKDLIVNNIIYKGLCKVKIKIVINFNVNYVWWNFKVFICYIIILIFSMNIIDFGFYILKFTVFILV